jgi:hypothetical protein
MPTWRCWAAGLLGAYREHQWHDRPHRTRRPGPEAGNRFYANQRVTFSLNGAATIVSPYHLVQVPAINGQIETFLSFCSAPTVSMYIGSIPATNLELVSNYYDGGSSRYVRR